MPIDGAGFTQALTAGRISAVAGLAVAFAMTASEIRAQSDAPLSAIDWLDAPTSLVQPDPRSAPEPRTSTGVNSAPIDVTPLGLGTGPAVGLVPARVTGLAPGIWASSNGTVLANVLRRTTPPRLPAMQALLYSLLLTETLPPAARDDDFQAARLDMLMRMGALDPALSLAEEIGPTRSPDLFQRYFDLALLSGVDATACTTLRAMPRLSPGPAPDIYCAARSGDWNTASLLYGTADALGLIAPDVAEPLLRFLDPDLFDDDTLPTPRSTPDALTFALYDALGQRLPTRSLPRVFAQADVTDRAGWKPQLEAAERLATLGALPDNRLAAIYLSRRPAASGGIWDRVAAIQRLDAALRAQDATALSDALPEAWNAARAAGLATRWATLYGPEVGAFDLTGPAAEVAFQMLLLSPDYASAPARFPDQSARFCTLAAIARGDARAKPGQSDLEAAVSLGLSTAAPDSGLMAQASDGAVGAALLGTLRLIETGGAEGDLARLPSALATLRALGLDDTARRTGIELILGARARL